MHGSRRVPLRSGAAAVAAVVVALVAGPAAPLGATAPAGPVPATATRAAPPGPPAAAAADRTLPVNRVHGLVVDPATGRIVVSGDDAVSVRHPDGSEAATFDGLGDPQEITVHDGTAYVLLHDDPTILVIDVAGATEVARWDLGTEGAVMGLAVASGRVWTTAVVVEPDQTQLVSVDLATGAVLLGRSRTWSPMRLTVSPTDPSLLAGVGVARVQEGGDGQVRLIDVDTGDVVARPSLVPFPADVAFAADGSTVHVAASYSAVHHEYRVPDLSRGRISYVAGTYPSAVSTSSRAGGLVAVGSSNTGTAPDVVVFRQGVPAPVATFARPTDDGGQLARAAVALTPLADAVWAADEWIADRTRPAELRVVALAPAPGAPTPQVLGTRGGATIELAGTALGRSTATIGGQPAETVRSAPGALALRAPALPGGSAPVVVTNGAGRAAPAAAPALVVDLGPHGDAHALADAMARAFLRRPATAAEAAAEDARLAGGGAVGALPLRLAAEPAFSRHRAPLVRLYQAVFLRPPDTAGLAFWLARMEGGQTLDSVAAAFAGTPEFRGRYGALGDAAFVDRTYANVLGRAPDADGRAYWVDQLARGVSRGRVTLQVSASPEYRARVADQVALISVAVGVLGRTPTQAELTAALARIAAGGTLVAEATRLVRSAPPAGSAR